MNNKGFTVVELIITFVIVMTISLGLFSTVDSYRERQQKEMYRKEVTNYRNEVLKAIENDITRYNFEKYEKIDVTNDSTCNSSLGYNQGVNFTFKKIAETDEVEKALCFGNNIDLNADGTFDGKAAILYGDIKFVAPTKFIKFEQDIIDNVTENVDSKIPLVVFKGIDSTKSVFSQDSTSGLPSIIDSSGTITLDVHTVVKNIYSFNIRIKHEEIKSEFNLNATFSKPVGKNKVGDTITVNKIQNKEIELASYETAQLDYIKQAFINNGFVVGTSGDVKDVYIY